MPLTATLANPRSRRTRGSMLVIALGVLALLSILAVTFVSLMKLELLASKNYVDGVKARLIAEGGLEEAVTELKSRGGLDGVSNPSDDWVYANGNYWIPLEEATIKRDRLDPNDYANRCSFVGSLGASYAKGNDRYKIQVIDTQAQFNLNCVFDNSLTLDPNEREANVYTRTLRCLGEAIHKTNPRAKALNLDPVKDARYPLNNPRYFGAEAILAFRQSLEGKLFTSKYQLTEVLPSPDHYKLIRDYVTTKSWMDPKSGIPFNKDGGTNAAYTDYAVAKGNAGELTNQRAPINVNLAPVEVIAANLCGLGGRSVFMYFGDRSKTGILQPIDQGTPYAFAQRPEIQEELEYSSVPIIVYMGPMGYRPGNQYNVDPPLIDGALQIAKMIVARRANVPGTSSGGAAGPFKSYADWERWVDQNLTNDFFAQLKDASGNNAFPQPETAPMFYAKDHTVLAGTPTEAQVRATPRYRSWFFDCLRSIIKANTNPNARPSMLNPNAAVYLEVDKGNLIFPKELARNPSSRQATGDKFFPQTCEWCFGSKGIFEITSLGEVLGPDKTDITKTDDKNPFASAKVLTIVQIFDQVIHTSQRDFERNGHPLSWTASASGKPGFGDEKGQTPPGNLLRFGISSYPFPKMLWDPRVGPLPPIANPTDADRCRALELGGPQEGYHAHDDTGHLELAPRVTIKDKPNDTAVTNFGSPLFQLLFQDRKYRPIDATTGPLSPRFWDAFLADTANKKDQNPMFGVPFAGEATTAFAFPHPFRVPNTAGLDSAIAGFDAGNAAGPAEMFQKLINPDGFYSNEMRCLPLWYRASDLKSNVGQAAPDPDDRWPPSGSRQGESVTNPQFGPPNWEGGNVWATPTGGVEFWYKPEYDWYARNKVYSAPGAEPTIGYVAGPSGDVADERLVGILAATHCALNPDATHWENYKKGPRAGARPTRGTQMWVTRNTIGDLRVTRLYFEVVGTAGSEIPLCTDVRPAGGPDPKLPGIKLGGKDGYMERATTKPEYTWPPLEFQKIPPPWHDIKYARVDSWVPGSQLKAWRAREWHHVGIRWDDRGGLGAGKADSIEIYLDGVRATTVTHQIGPHYQAVVNTPAAVAPPINPPTEDQPAFVRVNHHAGVNGDNESGRRPKDEIQLGTFRRPQAQRGGLFKYDYQALGLTEPNLPSDGTLDDVRFYDGVGLRVNGFADRYEEYGIWTNEFDLSDRFVPGNDFLDLGNLQFTAYLPMSYGAARCQTRSGAGSVEVSFKIIKAASGTGGAAQEITYPPGANYDGWIREFTDNVNGIAGFRLVEPSGRSAVVGRNDRLIYTVRIFPARLQGGALGGDSADRNGFAVATPALDDITLVYFLPTARVLLKERVWD